MANFRKILATLSTVAILSTLVVTTAVSASAYTDVPADSWAKSYIDNLAQLGVFTGEGKFRPTENMSRAEFVKSVVVAAGLQGSTAITFPDVKDGDWFAPYVKTAVSNGVIGGYANGKFGPNDSLTREQAAKIVVNAFGLPKVTPASPSFSDVKSTDWSYSFVETLVSYGIVSGYGNGKFGPADNVTREQVAKIVSLALSPAAPVDNNPPVDTTVTGGDLGVSLSSSTPGAVTLPASATATAVFAVDLKAGDTDVTFNGFTVHKTGVGALASTFQAYLYDGNDRLTAGKSLNSSTNNIEFSSVGLKVEAGKTKTVMMKVDVGATAASGEVQFELADATAVKSTAEAVQGDFPIVSETIGLSTTSVGTITIAKNGSTTAPKVGEVGATVAKFTLNATTEAAKLSQLGLYVTGTISSADVTNLKLYVSGTTDPIATVDGVNSKDIAQFVFDTPYEIEKGGTKSFYVTADMTPGRNADTLAFYIDENTDVVALGATYGFGMAVTKTNYMSTTCTATSSTTCSFSTLEGGDITVVSSGPAAADIAVNAKDVHLMNFTITSVSDNTFKNFEVGLLGSESADTTEGLLNSTAANFTDVKIMNTETGETLMGPVDVTSFKTATGGATAITEAAGDNAQAYYLFTDEFSMSAGETLKLALTTDVANTTTLANMTLVSSLQIGSTYPQVKDVNNKTLTNSSSMVPSSAITGKTMTVKAPALTLSLASTPSSKTYVKGYKDVKFGGYTFACGSASACKITDVTLTGYIDDDANSTYQAGCQTVAVDGTSHATCLSTYVGSITLKDAAGNVIAASKGVNSTTGKVIFTNLSWNLKAGESVTAYAVGDISSNAYANSDGEKMYFAVAATTDVTAEDSDGNNISSVTGTPNSGTTVVATTSAGGTLTASVDSATPKENILIAGSADQALTKLKFTTTDEAFVINKLAVNNRQFKDNAAGTENDSVVNAALGNNDDNITSVKIVYTNSAGASESKTGTLTEGTAEFSGLDFPIAADSDATITLSATLNTITGGADAGTFVDLNLALENFEAVAQGSGDTYKASKIDAGTATLSVGTITWSRVDKDVYLTGQNDGEGNELYAAQAPAATLGDSATLTIDSNNADAVDLPVGTLLCVDDNNGGTCSGEDIYVVSARTDSGAYDTYTATLIDDAGDGDYDSADDVLISLPGTGYLTSSNQMQVYETKPTVALNSSSPSGSKTVATSDNAFIFDIAAGSAEKVQFRTGLSLPTCAVGLDQAGSNNGIAASSTTAAIDGADCLATMTNWQAGDTLSYDAGAVSTINQYARASFWIRSSGAPEFADIKYGTSVAAATDPITNIATLAASDCTFYGTATATTLTASSWFHCDVAVPTATSTERYFNFEVDEATELTGGVTLTIDQLVLYNDKIAMTLTGDDIDTYANMQADAADGTVVAYLKDGSDTLATGYVYKNTSAAAEGGSAGVTFVPISGTDSTIEVSKGTTRTFTVQLSTSALLAEDAGADDPLTFSINMGSSASGTVTAGGVWWNDTNFSNAVVGNDPGTSYSMVTATPTSGIIKWLGQVANTTLNSNTVKY